MHFYKVQSQFSTVCGLKGKVCTNPHLYSNRDWSTLVKKLPSGTYATRIFCNLLWRLKLFKMSAVLFFHLYFLGDAVHYLRH